MVLTFQLFRCPKCNTLLFFRIIKIMEVLKGYSGLGPSMIRCAKCGAIVNTGNMEWPHMSVKTKLYLWFLTIVYSLVLGLTLTPVILSLLGSIIGLEENAFITTPIVIVMTMIIGLPFLILQLIRIEASIMRTSNGNNEPHTTSFFNLHTNFQSLGMAVLIFWMIVLLIMYLLIL